MCLVMACGEVCMWLWEGALTEEAACAVPVSLLLSSSSLCSLLEEEEEVFLFCALSLSLSSVMKVKTAHASYACLSMRGGDVIPLLPERRRDFYMRGRKRRCKEKT